MKNQSIKQKLKNALNGIIVTYQTESNFRFHCYSAVAVILLLSVFHPALEWWALICICIGLVIAAELANTAIETLLDHLHPGFHSTVGKVKDIMAGMVLSLSVLAVVIALLAVLDALS